MKKVLVCLMVLGLLASVASAAKAPVVVVKPAAAVSSSMKMGMGAIVMGGINCAGFNALGNSAATWNFVGDTFSGAVGLNFLNLSANNATNTYLGVLGKYTMNITGGAAPMHVGAGISFNSIPNGSAFGINLLCGVETILASNVMIGFDLIPLTFASQTQNNASSTVFSLGSASIYTSYLF